MTPNVIKSAIKTLGEVEQAMWVQLNDHAVKDTKSGRIAEAVKSSLGHMSRAAQFLDAARREAEL